MCLKRVAIIGAGPSGIVACKYAIQYGLEPVVFEKTLHYGGLWFPNETAIWDGLKTDVMRFIVMFSDHPWPKESRTYPQKDEVYAYLTSYVKRFDLEKHFKLGHRIDHVKQNDDKRWTIDFENLTSGEKSTDTFDYLIVATGLFARPRMPTFDNEAKFKGLIMHSSKFRLNDPKLKSKDVIVVGSSLSGVDLSTFLVGHANSVVNLFRTAPLIIHNLLKFKIDHDNYSIIPYDLMFFSRALAYPPADLPKEVLETGRKKLFASLFPLQVDKNLCPDENLYVNLDDNNAKIVVSKSDFYLQHVKSNKLRPIKSNIKSYDENGVHLENGQYFKADVVIYCTGYDQSLDFFEESILNAIQYSTVKPKIPHLLYKYTFPTNVENLAFVGHTMGLFNGGFEIQSKWAAMVFTGQTKLPDRSVMGKFIECLKEKRDLDQGGRFPYGMPVNLVDELAKEVDLMPNLEEIKLNDRTLYDMMWNNEVFVTHFFYDQNKDLADDLLRQVDEIKKKVYKLNNDQPGYDQTQINNEFTKNFKL